MRRPEQLLQQQIVRFIDAAYPALLYFHCPNGGARTKVEAGILKSMGVKAGVPDLTIILPTGRAAFIELKAGKNDLTDKQETFRDSALKLGCFWEEARTLEGVAAILEGWLQPFGWIAKARIAA